MKSGNELSISSIQTSALSILGFFILSNAIPQLPHILTVVIFPETNSSFPSTVYGLGSQKTLIPWDDIVYLAVRLGLGFWFIFGSSGILYYISKVRNACLKTDDQVP